MSLPIDRRIVQIESHLRDSAHVKRLVAEQCSEAILSAADLVTDAFRHGNKVLLCGNGGSAADCQHMAAEFTSRLTMDFARPGLPAIALTTDTSFLTAYANDFDFSGVFARQIQALGKPGDVLIGLSTSGNSKNVIKAVDAARRLNMQVIILCGSGGKLKDLADVAICVPSTKTQFIQESHLAAEHIVCHLVERALFGEMGVTESIAA